MSEIARLEQKIDSFMDSQKETNNRLSISIEKVADAVLQNQAQQVEINQLTSMVQKLDYKHDNFGQRLGEIETNIALANDFRSQAVQLKWVTIGLGVAIFSGMCIAIFKMLLEQ